MIIDERCVVRYRSHVEPSRAVRRSFEVVVLRTRGFPSHTHPADIVIGDEVNRDPLRINIDARQSRCDIRVDSIDRDVTTRFRR